MYAPQADDAVGPTGGENGPVGLIARSTLKPVSLLELSVQARVIRLEETAAAERLPGEIGIAGEPWPIVTRAVSVPVDPRSSVTVSVTV